MPFDFAHPWILILIPLLIPVSVFMLKRRYRKPGVRQKAIMLLRSAVLFFLLLALAGTVILSSSGAATTIFLADTSDSSKNSRQEIEEFIRDALKTKDFSDNAGIVSFGLNSAVENSPSGSPMFNKLQTNINGSFTNIESGLKSAAALIPAGQRKRIVLITDGIENAGNAIKQAKLLRQNGITLDIHPIAVDAVPDALVRSLDIPSALHINESFEVVVEIYSNVETDATLRFFEGRNLDSTRAVTLKRGINRFAYSEKAEEGGFVTYRAEVWFEGDGVSENNYLSAYSYVSDTPKVLLVSEKELEDNELWKILKDDLNIELCKPEAVPVQLTELQKYDAFILNDVYADALSPDFLSGLKIMVENQGKGLLTTGGENSYAIGGYNNTELEEILPVNMEIIPKEEDPNLGLVLVIDKSGSMSGGNYGVTKLDLAKEAAIRACEVLTSRDSIGVIAFDDAVQWVVKTGRVDDKEKVKELIATIRPGGGTSILPPLKEAYNSLRDTDAKLKHIILLTDGQAEKTGYDEVIENIRMDGITLSTVAVGSGADMQLLASLAEGGKGRYYTTEKFTDIPKIIAKETFLAGKTYVNNRTFAPKLTGFSEILSGINTVPYLDGYIGTTRKQTANVIFSSDTDDPILATWQYGLGRTAAWTSDADGMWTNPWLTWEQYPKFWKNIISWILQQHTAGEYTLEASLSEGRGNVKLTLPSGETYQGSAEARITSPEGNVQTIELSPLSPGVFEGSFIPEESGVYLAGITLTKDGVMSYSASTGVNIPYSPEYDTSISVPEAFFERLSAEGGGRVIYKAGDVFKGQLEDVNSVTDITPYLILAAAICFLLEVVVKRLNLPVEKLTGAMSLAVSAIGKTVRNRPETPTRIRDKDIKDNKGNRDIKDIKDIDINDKYTKIITAEDIKDEKPRQQETPSISKLLERKRKLK